MTHLVGGGYGDAPFPGVCEVLKKHDEFEVGLCSAVADGQAGIVGREAGGVCGRYPDVAAVLDSGPALHELRKEQNELMWTLNECVQKQNELMQTLNEFVQRQNELMQALNEFVQGQNELMQTLNEFVQRQNELMQTLNEFVQGQNELM
ncbi:MAG: hypothetical protein WBG34_12105 [Flavobacteriales bacterium]